MKFLTQVSLSIEERANGAAARVSKSAPASANVAEIPLELPNEKINTGDPSVRSGAGFPFEGLGKGEKQLKRERRKQANRESARKSRLRKQAEVDELKTRYDSLYVENTALKTELDQLKENSEKLRLENAALMEKLKNTQVGQQEGMVSSSGEAGITPPNSLKNNPANSDTASAKLHHECESLENSNSETNHHLMKTSSRADPGSVG